MQEIVKNIVKTILLGQWATKNILHPFFGEYPQTRKNHLFQATCVCNHVHSCASRYVWGTLLGVANFLLETAGARHHLCCREALGASQQLVFATPPA